MWYSEIQRAKNGSKPVLLASRDQNEQRPLKILLEGSQVVTLAETRFNDIGVIAGTLAHELVVDIGGRIAEPLGAAVAVALRAASPKGAGERGKVGNRKCRAKKHAG